MRSATTLDTGAAPRRAPIGYLTESEAPRDAGGRDSASDWRPRSSRRCGSDRLGERCQAPKVKPLTAAVKTRARAPAPNPEACGVPAPSSVPAGSPASEAEPARAGPPLAGRARLFGNLLRQAEGGPLDGSGPECRPRWPRRSSLPRARRSSAPPRAPRRACPRSSPVKPLRGGMNDFSGCTLAGSPAPGGELDPGRERCRNRAGRF